MIRHFLLYVILLLGYSIGWAGTIDPNTPDSKHMEYGSKFIHTAKVYGETSDNTPYFGSGVAYDSKIIITAAHIVHNIKTCKVRINNKTIKVKDAISHPEFVPEVFGHNDIAICILEEDIGLDWYPDLYTNKDELNKTCSIAGYGLFGTFLTGGDKFDDNLRAGSNKISFFDRDMMMCDPSRSNRTELEFCIASGDSGGGLFIDNKLAGINSCVIHDKDQIKSTYGTYSGHTRISNHIQWIKDTLSNIKE